MNIKDFEKHEKDFIRELGEALENLLNEAGLKMRDTTKELQKETNSYASGKLRNSTDFSLKKEKRESFIVFGANAKNKGYQYGIVQEFGRPSGTYPNIKDLSKWVKRKAQLGHLILEKELGKTRKKRIDTLTYLIARSIYKKGFEGKFFYKKGFEAGSNLFAKKINNVIEKVFKKVS